MMTIGNEPTNKCRKDYLDGMKGIACVLIMCAHYYGIYKYANNKDVISLRIFQLLEKKTLSFFVNESFWLSLFFVISGYSLSLSSIERLRDLLVKCIKRALRFLLPIYGACFFIFILYSLVGFHNLELNPTVSNPWLESFYIGTITIKDLLLEPIKVVFLVGHNPKFSGPWWCISGMFWSSILVYIFNFLRKNHPRLAMLILLIIAFFGWRGRENQHQGIVVAMLIGMAVCWYEKAVSQVIKSKMIYVIGCILVVILSALQIRTDLKPLYFAVILGIIPHLDSVRRLLAYRMPQFGGKISFGIYSFHWPIFCSLGALILKLGLNKLSMGMLFAATYFVSITTCLLLSYIYYITVEKYTSKVLNKMI